MERWKENPIKSWVFQIHQQEKTTKQIDNETEIKNFEIQRMWRVIPNNKQKKKQIA